MARIKYKDAMGIEAGKGRPPIGKKPEKAVLKKLYIKELKSIREIANLLGCSKDMVYRALQEYDLNRRSKVRKSQLRFYDFDFLKNEILKKGYKQVAAELGIGITTLRDYMKSK